ncbi:hypothetical protein ACFVH6_22320 [Spirillospora sp. NPDC127200]
MAAPKNMTPQERILRAKLASNAYWGRMPDPADRRKATAKARANNPSTYAYWLRKVQEEHPDLSAKAQAAAAKNLHSAEMSRRALKSSQTNTKGKKRTAS